MLNIKMKSPFNFKLTYFSYLIFPIIFFKLLLEVFPHDGGAKHDEIQHLRIIYGMIEGVFPHKDFIDNHPVFLHIIFSKIISFFHIQNPYDSYVILKALMIGHIIGVFFLLHYCVSKVGAVKNSLLHSLTLYAFILCTLDIWEPSSEWIWGVQSIWQFRMDWFSYFYGIASIFCMIKSRDSNARNSLIYSSLGGVFLAFSLAILPKVVFFIIPLSIVVFLVIRDLPFHQIISSLLEFKWNFISFLFSTLFIYFFIIFYETNFIEKSPQDYFNYVFTINSSRHPLVVNLGFYFGPISAQLKMLRADLIAAFFLVIAAFFVLHKAKKKSLTVHFWTLLFGFLIIIFNSIIPDLSNGLSWPWYFIPTILAACLIIQVFFQIDQFVFLPVLLFAYSLLFIAIDLERVLPGIRTEHAYKCLIEKDCYDEELNVELPPSYSVFSIRLNSMPILSKPANFYIFGIMDYRFWKDYHNLNLGPNYIEDLINGLKRKPEVLNFPSIEEFKTQALFLLHSNSFSISYYHKFISANYDCLKKGSKSYFFRKDLIARQTEDGWVSCTSLPEK